jgi:hypothetical protein
MHKQFTPALATIGAAMFTIGISTSAQAVVLNPQYLVDDGIAESAVGLRQFDEKTGNCTAQVGTVLADFMWLNEFEVEPEGEWIDSVSLAWGAATENPCPNQETVLDISKDKNGKPKVASLFLYQFDEKDKTLKVVSQAQTEVTPKGASTFVNVKFDQARRVEGRFFVGALFPEQRQGEFPAAFDTTMPQGKSWFGSVNLINPTGSQAGINLGGPSLALSNLVQYPLGNWLLRANSVQDPMPIKSVPESNPAIGLLAIAVLGTGAILKRNRK